MSNKRRLGLVAAAALAVVLAVGAAGSALAFGPWGQAQVPAQAQGQDGQTQQGWTCPAFANDETAQAMRDAMRNRDFDQMQDLMRQRFGEGFQGMMSGANAEAMRGHMQGADFDKMQEFMRNGDWDGMREYMREQGLGDLRLQTPGAGMMGPGGFGGMMTPAQPRTDRPQSSATPATPRQGATGGPVTGGMMGGYQAGANQGAQAPSVGPNQGGMMGGSFSGGMMGRR